MKHLFNRDGGAIRRAVARRVAVWRALATARRDTQRALARRGLRRVLIVCHGNIYRSPFAEAVLRDRLGADVEVRSAGFHAVADRPSPQPHVAMCQEFGVSLAAHRSRVVTDDDLAWADLIVLMDRRNWLALSGMRADPDKLVWLGALGPGRLEIADPYGLGPSAAAVIVKELNFAVRQLALRLGHG